MRRSRAEQTPDTGFRELLEAVRRRIYHEKPARLAREVVRIPSVYHPEEAEVPIVTTGAGEREIPHHRDE